MQADDDKTSMSKKESILDAIGDGEISKIWIGDIRILRQLAIELAGRWQEHGLSTSLTLHESAQSQWPNDNNFAAKGERQIVDSTAFSMEELQNIDCSSKTLLLVDSSRLSDSFSSNADCIRIELGAEDISCKLPALPNKLSPIDSYLATSDALQRISLPAHSLSSYCRQLLSFSPARTSEILGEWQLALQSANDEAFSSRLYLLAEKFQLAIANQSVPSLSEAEREAELERFSAAKSATRIPASLPALVDMIRLAGKVDETPIHVFIANRDVVQILKNELESESGFIVHEQNEFCEVPLRYKRIRLFVDDVEKLSEKDLQRLIGEDTGDKEISRDADAQLEITLNEMDLEPAIRERALLFTRDWSE